MIEVIVPKAIASLSAADILLDPNFHRYRIEQPPRATNAAIFNDGSRASGSAVRGCVGWCGGNEGYGCDGEGSGGSGGGGGWKHVQEPLVSRGRYVAGDSSSYSSASCSPAASITSRWSRKRKLDSFQSQRINGIGNNGVASSNGRWHSSRYAYSGRGCHAVDGSDEPTVNPASPWDEFLEVRAII